MSHWNVLASACVAVLGYEDVDVIVRAAEQPANTDPVDAVFDAILIVEEPSTVDALRHALGRLDPNDRELVESAYGLNGRAPASCIEASRITQEPLGRLQDILVDLRGILVVG
jgi:hypothetical protein